VTSEVTSPNRDELELKARLSLLLVAPLSGLAQAGLSPILPKLSEHFAGQPGADTLVRLLVSAVPAAMILGSLGGGILADRYGQRRVLLWALFFYALAGTSGYFVDNLPGLLAGRVLLGVCNAAASVIVAAIIASRFAQQLRDRWLGFFVTAGTGSAIAMLLVAGALGERNWRLVFLLHIVALVALLIIAMAVPEHKSAAPTRAAKVQGNFPLVFVLYGLAIGALVSVSTIFLPYFLKAIGETNSQRIASAIIPNAIAGAIMSFAYGWVRARMGTVSIFVAAFGLGAVGMLTMIITRSYSGALVANVLVGAAVGLVAPHIISAAAEATPRERRSSVIGIVRAAASAGPIVIQLSLEPVTLNYGIGHTLLALAAFDFLVAGLTIPGRRWLLPA
jgi:MFS family permease